MWADERLFFLSLFLSQDGNHWYVQVKQHAKAFSAKPPSSFLYGCHCQHIRPTILGYADILRCTISSDEHAADVATGALVRLRLDEISHHQQQQQHQSCQTKPMQFTGRTYQRFSIWRWQPDGRLWRYLLRSWFCFVPFSFTLLEKVWVGENAKIYCNSQQLEPDKKSELISNVTLIHIPKIFLTHFWFNPWEFNYTGKHLQLNNCFLLYVLLTKQL